MIITLALCANKYTESLINIALQSEKHPIIHTSSKKNTVDRLIHLYRILTLLMLRWIVTPLTRGEFHLYIPHTAGRYSLALKLLKPTRIIIIDDGITFEYWSSFHETHITPLTAHHNTALLIGCRQPNWPPHIHQILETKIIPRHEIMRNLIYLDKPPSISTNTKPPTGVTPDAWIIDDGSFDDELIYTLQKLISEKYGCTNISVLWHPTRTNKKSDGNHAPAELTISKNINNTSIVLGRTSTVLFNLASIKPSFTVASIPSGHTDLDHSAQEQGILIIEL